MPSDNVVSFADAWAHLRSGARSKGEVQERDAEMARFSRASRAVGLQEAVKSVHDADSVEGADEILPDALSAEGIVWANRWLPDQPGAIVWGQQGSGKSTLLCRALRRLSLANASHPDSLGYGVCFCSLSSLISTAAQLDFRGGYADWLAALGRVDVLALDDWGTATLVRGKGQYLWAVLDARWRTRKPLLVTSNIDPGMDREMGLRYAPEDALEIERGLDRLHALAPLHIRYDSPVSRRRSGQP